MYYVKTPLKISDGRFKLNRGGSFWLLPLNIKGKLGFRVGVENIGIRYVLRKKNAQKRYN